MEISKAQIVLCDELTKRCRYVDIVNRYLKLSIYSYYIYKKQHRRLC